MRRGERTQKFQGGVQLSCTVYTHPPRTTVSMLRYETSFVFLLVWGGHLLEYVYTREVRQLYSCKVGTRKVKRFRV